jgi:hypothetical protein
MYKTKMILALAQAIRGSLEDSWMARRQLVAIKRIVMKRISVRRDTCFKVGMGSLAHNGGSPQPSQGCTSHFK